MRIFKTLVAMALSLGMLAACGKDEDSIIPDQRDAIKRFLDSNNLEYQEVNGVFQHFGARGEEEAPIVKKGSKVGFYYELYKAAYTRSPAAANKLAPIPTGALYSNKQFVVDSLKSIGLDPSFWSIEIYTATVGSNQMVNGLNRGLEGCRQGDSVLLFITSNLAFGDKPIGVLEENTAVVYIVNVESVDNQ